MKLLAKALVYRLVAVCITVGIAWLVTGETAFAVRIGVLDAALKTAAYYLFDRAWLRL